MTTVILGSRARFFERCRTGPVLTSRYSPSVSIQVGSACGWPFGISVTTVARPVSANRRGGDSVFRTAAVYQYAGDGSYDGHFVSTRNSGAVADWLAFLTSAAATGTPTVP